jgi:hypothetical protein
MFIQKLTSRKFWALVTVLVVAILVAFNVEENTITKVTAIIGAFASVISYIFAEAYVDGQKTKARDK